MIIVIEYTQALSSLLPGNSSAESLGNYKLNNNPATKINQEME